MVRLVNDLEYRQRLANDAREYARAEFTWNSVAEKYLNLYQSS
jgi:glycosyltransferase involved in cell wall biosynthesis